MMKTGCTGTERPKDGAVRLRRVVLALAVLLLTCVLMAGAVSAESISVDNWKDLKDNLTTGNSVILSGPITANDQLTLTDKTVTLDLNGHTITGTPATDQDPMLLINGGSLTIQDSSPSKEGAIDRNGRIIRLNQGHLTVNSGTINSYYKDGAAISVYGSSTDVENYASVTIGKDAKVIGYQYCINIGQNNSKSYGVSVSVSGKLIGNQTSGGSALYINGVVKPTEGNIPEISISQDAVLQGIECPAVYAAGYGKWTINGGTFTGDEALSIKSGEWIIKGGTFTGNGPFFDPAVSNSNGSEPTGAAVSVTTNHDYPKNVNLTITGGTFTSESQSAFYEGENSKNTGTALIGVKISGGSFTTKNTTLSAVTIHNSGNASITNGISIKDAAGNNLLYRGVNLTGVAEWTGDESGYTLTIDEAGSYKLMDGFTTTGSGIQITADGVTLDGNGKTITVGQMTESAAALTVTKTAAGTTLKNLNMTASPGSETGATMEGMVKLLARTTIQGGKLDMSGMSLPVDGTYGSNPTVVCISGNHDGTTISDVTMSAPKRESPEDDSIDRVNSNTFCVFINSAKNVKLDGNTFNLGGNAQRSVGVEVRGGSTGTVINGNTINAPENVENVRAVQIFTNGDAGESLTITNNKLIGSYKAAVNAVLTSDASNRAENPTLPVTIKGNTIHDAKAGITISGTSETVTLKVTGTVEAADFSDLSQDQIISGTGVDVTDVDFNPQPQPTYSSSSGNMNNAYRVLFNDGATTLSVQTDLSSGDKLTKPETPVKDGYTFAGWYKDSACTQAWDFETGIPGDMTLYAKWTAAGSSGETEATTAPTATSTAVTTPQPTKTQSTTATTSAPQATTTAGVSPTLTQAPAPVAGALFGLLAAGVLLRRRFQ